MGLAIPWTAEHDAAVLAAIENPPDKNRAECHRRLAEQLSRTESAVKQRWIKLERGEADRSRAVEMRNDQIRAASDAFGRREPGRYA